MKTIFFEVWYAKNMPSSLKMEPAKFYAERFVKVGEFKSVSLDDLFLMLNSPENPLGSYANQEFIGKHGLHTSMSVGDAVVIKETGDIFYCSALGWTNGAGGEGGGMNWELMILFGFDQAVKDVESGRCPFCRKKVQREEFQDDLSRKEFEISGICQQCQDETFGK